MLEKLEKLFGKKEQEEKSVPVVVARPRPAPGAAPAPVLTDPAPRPAAASPASPPVPAPAPSRPSASTPVSSPLRSADEGHAAEQRAKASMAAIASAAAPAPALALPDDVGVREHAAAYFAAGEHKRAIDMLVGHLNKTSGNAPQSIWFMLMDAYQALGQQAAFEKSACLFADFFKTSPPSWDVPTAPAASPAPAAMGRNVLVIEGPPSSAHAVKLKDFAAAARQAGQARLDLSRIRLSEDNAQRSDDLRILLDLMRRLRRREVATLLMGEGQLVEMLRGIIQQDLAVPQPQLYWEVVLEFMQWRGQEDAYEDLAISYARKFGRSAPGYESSGVVAAAPMDTAPAQRVDGLVPPPSLDEAAMEQWCDRIGAAMLQPPSLEKPLRLAMGGVRMIAFGAAGLLAARLSKWAWPPQAVVVEQPSELVWALFDITGVSGQVRIQPRRR